MSQQTAKFCSACGSTLVLQARFCAQCGAPVGGAVSASAPRPTQFTARSAGIVLVSAIVIWSAVWLGQARLAGTKPSGLSTASRGATETSNSASRDGGQMTGGGHGGESLDAYPDLVALQKAAEANPKDKERWLSLADAIAQRVPDGADPEASGLVFEAIGALRKVLDIDPKDSEALLAMAEISFNQRAFGKAVEFYRQYLEVAPDDLDVQSRFASALTFTGKFDDALGILQHVLEKNPKHFHALAYSAVAYAQKGDRAAALRSGEAALEQAPSDDARARFGQFLDSVRGESGAPKDPSKAGAVANDGSHDVKLSSGAAAIREFIAANKVAGPKLAGIAERAGGVVVVRLKQFPMAQMPPMIRERFVTGIRAELEKQQELSAVVLEEATDGALLETIRK